MFCERDRGAEARFGQNGGRVDGVSVSTDNKSEAILSATATHPKVESNASGSW